MEMLRRRIGLLLVAAALLGAVFGLVPEHLGAQAVGGNPTQVPGLEACSYLLGPTEFRYAAEESWTRVSAATEAVAQIIRPVIVRSSPLLPAIRINFIDEHIFSRIEQSGMEAAALSSDTEFLRRVTLDLTGRIPDADTVVAFVADTNRAKRDALIDGLAVSPEYVDRWTMFFGDLFRLNRPGHQRQSLHAGPRCVLSLPEGFHRREQTLRSARTGDDHGHRG